jgi:hypothetical protein
LDNLDPSISVNLESSVFVPNGPIGSWQVEDMGHYRGVVMSLHIQGKGSDNKETWGTVEGSAVLVGPGIAMVAAHVLTQLRDPLSRGKAIASCVGYDQDAMYFWRITSVAEVERTELAILTLEYRSPMPKCNLFRFAQVTTRMPAIGEEVLVVGFRASTENLAAIEFIDNVPVFPVRGRKAQFGTELRVGIGTVTQHHLSGRGLMLPGPTIEVNVATAGGMSGGAAFDSRGHLCGIISSSVDHGDGAGTTFVSHIVPALGVPVMHKFGNILNEGARCLADLHPAIIRIDGYDRVKITRAPRLGLTRLEWDCD